LQNSTKTLIAANTYKNEIFLMRGRPAVIHSSRGNRPPIAGRPRVNSLARPEKKLIDAVRRAAMMVTGFRRDEPQEEPGSEDA
jgi:hypothetical protein